MPTLELSYGLLNRAGFRDLAIKAGTAGQPAKSRHSDRLAERPKAPDGEMNEWPDLGGGQGLLSDRLWVIAAKGRAAALG